MTEPEIYVTKPFLPPLREFLPALERIWESKIVTNGGPFHREFEAAVAAYLGVDHLSLFTNGTLALLTALRALGLSGEVITTPFSFVATSHCLLWSGIKPIFVDIEPATLSLDPAKIAAAITPETTAILAVHCFGRSCDTGAIQKIADRHNLKVIYDAAHAFGTEDEGGSILRHGDLSVLSFHATKVFNTFEGGAIVCPDVESKIRVDHLKDFGIVGEEEVVAAGINGKMSEFNAALGLYQLKFMDQVNAGRKRVNDTYISLLSGIGGLRCLNRTDEPGFNHAYFPILVGDEYPLSRDELYEELKDNGIHSRRYFYPLIPDFPMYREVPSADPANLPVAKDVVRRILCLPIYPDLELAQVEKICGLVARPVRPRVEA
jgi:dTDP-4-amino-4,6-dideoxygalactose transaminase